MDTPQKKPNLFWRIIRGIYRAIDSSRRFAMNVIFVLIVVVLFAAIGSSVPTMQGKTALVIAPRGEIVEQYTSNPTDRAFARAFGDEVREVQLRDIVRALDAASRDANIDRVVLVTDEISGAGMATLAEIGAALKRFKAAGKEIVAYGDNMDQRGYYLAAHADRVYLNPDGAILLEGLGRYRTYFKGALDKLGIEARLFRVGEYKSAGEPYIRENQSDEARQADLYWMGDLWQRYLADVAELRRLDAAKLAADIENIVPLVQAAGGDVARMAKDQGLVDELRTRDQLREELVQKGAADEEHHTFRQVSLDDYVGFLDATQLPTTSQQIAVVVAQGEIVDGDMPPGVVGGESTSQLIRKAREDDDVKALVLRVDSPGGSVFPSELIRREVELTREAGKPVIVSMGDVAASGGYWISMNADRIVAAPNTITGSIGIYGLWFNAPQALDKLGLRTDGVGTTWITGATDPTREYDPRLGEFIQSVIDRGYRQFIGKVAVARESTPEAIDKIARGRVWSGAQAKERGLVDQLGTLRDAVTVAADQAKLGDDYRVVYVEKELSPFERFVTDMMQGSIGMAANAGFTMPDAWLPKQTRDDLAQARRLLGDAVKQKPAAIYALCECVIR